MLGRGKIGNGKSDNYIETVKLAETGEERAVETELIAAESYASKTTES